MKFNFDVSSIVKESISFEEILLSNRTLSYCFRRVQGPALTNILIWIVFVLRLTILADFFDFQVLLSLSLIEQLGFLFYAAWWGFLDFFRAQLKITKFQDRIVYIRTWWKRSWLLGAFLIAILGISLIGTRQLEMPRLNVQVLTTWVLILKVCLDAPLVFLHSCSFAFRRVYYPIKFILVGEIFQFLIVLGLARSIGPWSLFWGVSATVLFQLMTQTYYYLASYKSLRLPLHGLRLHGRRRKNIKVDPDSWMGALISAGVACLARAPVVLVIFGFYFFNPMNARESMLYCIPAFHFCGAWPRSFYSDFRRWSGEPWQNLIKLTRGRMLKAIAQFGAATGIVAVGVLLLLGFNLTASLALPLLLCPLITVLSFLATQKLAETQALMAERWQGIMSFNSVTSISLFKKILRRRSSEVRLVLLYLPLEEIFQRRLRKLALQNLDGHGLLLSIRSQYYLVADWRTSVEADRKIYKSQWILAMQGFCPQIEVLRVGKNGSDCDPIFDQPFFMPLVQEEVKLNFVTLASFLARFDINHRKTNFRSQVLQNQKIKTKSGSLMPVIDEGNLVGFTELIKAPDTAKTI